MWPKLLRPHIFRRKSPDQLVRLYNDGPPMRLLRNFERFQKDDGVPVYIKGGIGDKILLGITVIGVAIGLSDGFYTLFQMAKPKKKK